MRPLVPHNRTILKHRAEHHSIQAQDTAVTPATAEMKDSRFFKNILSLLLRLGISFGILAYIFHSSEIDLASLWALIQKARPWWLVAGVAVYGFAILFTLARWHIMLHRQGIPLPLKRTIHIGMIGVFFNSFMLGSTGGDLIKAFYVSKETNDKKTAAVTTVFADRIFGLLGLFILSGIVAITHIPTFSRNGQIATLISFLLAAFVISVLGLWLLAQNRLWQYLLATRPVRKLLHFVPTMVQQITVKVYDAFHLYYQYPRTLMLLLFLSTMVHAVLVLNAFFLARALGIHELGLHGFFLIIPIVTFVSSVPISISGLGIRDQLIVFLLASHGIPEIKGLALSLSIFVCVVTWSLLGGIGYIFRPSALPESSTE